MKNVRVRNVEMGTESAENMKIDMNVEKERVITIAPTSPYDEKTGGVENFVRIILPAMEKTGFTPVLFGVEKTKNAAVVSHAETEQRYEFESAMKTGKKSGFALRFYLGLLLRGKKVIRPGDILHVHRLEPLAPLLLHRNPKVVTIHVLVRRNLEMKRGKPVGTLYRIYENFVLNNPGLFGIRKILFVNGEVMGQYLKLFPRLAGISVHIRTGIDVAKFRPYSDDERKKAREKLGIRENEALIIFVGRLTKEKNLHLLLDVFRILEQNRGEVRLIIAGGGPLEGELKGYSARLGLKNASFLGNIPYDEVPGYIGAADLFIMTSTTEGASLAVFESLASCCPVVSTDVGINRDVIKDGVTGFVVTENNPEKLAEKALKVIEQRERFRKNCIGCGAVFSIDRIAEKYSQVYMEIARK